MQQREREREREKERSHLRGDFRHPNFQNVFVRKDDDDGHTYFFSKKEETRKIKTGGERKKRARDVKRICSFAQKKRVVCFYL